MRGDSFQKRLIILSNDMYKYSISLKPHWENAKSVVLYIIGAIFGYFFLNYKYGTDNSQFQIKVVIFIFILFLVPQLILHLRYYWLNRGCVFYYYPSELKINIQKTVGNETEFFLDDIKQVHYFKSFPLAENRMQWLATDSYSYARIYLKNGQQFLITSLVVPNMNLPLEQEKIRLSKTLYAYPLRREKPLEEKTVHIAD